MPFIKIYDEANDRILTKQIKSYGRCHCCETEFTVGQKVYTFRGNDYCDTEEIIQELEDSREIDTRYLEGE